LTLKRGNVKGGKQREASSGDSSGEAKGGGQRLRGVGEPEAECGGGYAGKKTLRTLIEMEVWTTMPGKVSQKWRIFRHCQRTKHATPPQSPRAGTLVAISLGGGAGEGLARARL